MSSNEIILKLIEAQKMTEPQIVGNVAMIGLLNKDAPENTPVISLRKALRQKKIAISEGPRGYTTLRAKSEVPTLVRASEGFAKAGKQDRVKKRSEVVSGESVMDVYCIERGRWSRGTEREWQPINLPVTVRRAVLDGRDQSTIWDIISRYLQEWKVASRSDALSAIYDALGQQFEKYVANFEWWDNQVGMIVFINGVTSGLELFGAKDLFREDGMIILRESYVPEALKGTSADKVPMLPGDVSNALTQFVDELKQNKRRIEVVQYNGGVAYATVV